MKAWIDRNKLTIGLIILGVFALGAVTWAYNN